MNVINLPKPAKPADLAALAQEIVSEQKAARDSAQSAIKHAIRCGALLIEAKAKVKHGQWLPWLQESCYLPERTAQAYMNLARHADSLPSDMTVRDALKLLTSKRKPRKTLTYAAKPKGTDHPEASKSATVADSPDQASTSEEPTIFTIAWLQKELEETISDSLKVMPKCDVFVALLEAVEKCFPETGFSINALPEE